MPFVIKWYFKIYKKAVLMKLELNYLIIFSVTMLDVKNRQKIRVFIENFMEKYSYWRKDVIYNHLIYLYGPTVHDTRKSK